MVQWGSFRVPIIGVAHRICTDRARNGSALVSAPTRAVCLAAWVHWLVRWLAGSLGVTGWLCVAVASDQIGSRDDKAIEAEQGIGRRNEETGHGQRSAAQATISLRSAVIF